eukprot:TRINITY_DN39420_c0_g2_i1.p2 TRINITY_DN39420_c0_g2~~TRINITY_DN39420_c0_g2_i1.p2  ORF type:complete len:127 (+),score=19.42 TRINITY_DN39420_c0_g2_i1:53-382(+)
MAIAGTMSEVASQLAELKLAKGGNQCKVEVNASSTWSGGSGATTGTSEERLVLLTQLRTMHKDIRRPLRWVDELDIVPKKEQRREVSSWTSSSLLRLLSAVSTRICSRA